ncbi:hypothetical protein HN018_02925 [Lichenicola cladoniae]|uniref:Uncharacterized protein n=1 Tax=Lichenicola cladoniae TaxID=1484109 RepID=A0A6M8HLB8_9PROT|nr:hypothetical protein [Lichenicola cladoniae]NPD68912.1 hypothetical protein [Acetobacteraceae bacterium]QKE89141.1 hypothetical protein HN018_02925 [Lichenicola cladoniae]
MVGITTAAIAALPHAVPSSDDAELMAIGREAASLIEKRRPLEARWWSLPAGTRQYDNAQREELTEVSEAMQPIDDRLSDLSDRSLVLRASSREAMIAKAHLIRHEMEVVHVTAGVLDPEMFDPHEAIVWSLLEDLLGPDVAHG